MPILAACGSSSTPTATFTPVVTATTTPTSTTALTATAAPTTTVTATPRPTATPTVTATATATPTATPNTQPVKFGALCSWSGPAALAGGFADETMDVVMVQVKKQGGVLGGRPLQITKYDDGTKVSNAELGYEKLVLQDQVSAVVFGAAISAGYIAASDAAEKLKVPLFSIGVDPADLSNRPYTIRAGQANVTDQLNAQLDYIMNKIKPQKVAILFQDSVPYHSRADYLKSKFQAAGVQIVSEQYIPDGTLDYSSFLTKLKYSNSDVVLMTSAAPELYISVFKQIGDVGGWGNMKAIALTNGALTSAVTQLTSSEGALIWSQWVPGQNTPGSKEFEQAFMEVKGKPPVSADLFFYYALWIAIKSVQLAGSDNPTLIAQAARSGNLQWEGPGGLYISRADGTGNLFGRFYLVKGGQVPPAP